MASVVFALVQELQEPPWRGRPAATCDLALDSVFTLEILLRFLVCPDRRAFFLAAFNYIDLAAGPATLGLRAVVLLTSSSGTRVGGEQLDLALGVSSATPVLRLLKMLRRFEQFHLLWSAFQIALEALPVLLFTLLLIILIFSVGLYWCEPRDNLATLSSTLWLTMVTMATVGYGDQVPQSDAGRVITSLLMIVSALYMAMPIGIVGSAFNRVWEDRDRLLLLQRIRQHLAEKGYSARDITELFLFFDEDKDGTLSFAEFEQMMSAVQLGISGERMVNLFGLFDRHGNGSIDDAEFVQTLFPHTFLQVYGPLQEGPVPVPPKEEPQGSVRGSRERRPGVTKVTAFRQSALFPAPLAVEELVSDHSSDAISV